MEASISFEAVDIADILSLLPHRSPFLVIDRVINIRSDFSGVGIKSVTFNEPLSAGHYPGVMMVEGIAQTACVVGMKLTNQTHQGDAYYFLTIDKCRFHQPPGPGDVIEYHVRQINRKRGMWWFHGDAKVDGVMVAEADVGAMLAA